MKSFLKNSLLLFFSIILGIYIAEGFLVLMTPDAEKNLTNINKIRVENAKKLKLDFDLRSPSQAFNEISKEINDLSINYRFSKTFFDFKTFRDAKNKNQIIPFRGPINKLTLTCAEDLQYKISKNDKHGFKNPNDSYKKNIDLIILGDSFAEGWCFDEKDDVSGLLKDKNINSLNLGIAGGGPLLSLAVMKEYVKHYKPKHLFFFYCEANDLADLEAEKNNFLLKKYLSENFSQEIMKNLDSKEIFLKKMDEEIREKFFKTYHQRILPKNEGEIFKEKIKDFFELSKLKSVLKPLIFYKNYQENEKLFFEIINKMNNFSKSNQIKFIFVYLPAWERYFAKFSKYNKHISKKNSILKKIDEMNIASIDIDKVFTEEKNLEKLFPLNYYGHYSRLGYKKVADSILLNLKEL
jgi:hypothetical protein